MKTRLWRVDVFGDRLLVVVSLVVAWLASHNHLASTAVPPVEDARALSSSSSNADVAETERSCPSLCRCDNLTSVVSNKRLLTVDCSYQNLELVPYDILTDTEALTLRVNLSLAHNIIHHINRNVFRAVSELRELILSGNRINGIEPLGFSGLRQLEYLSLDNNLLAVVPTASLQPLPSLIRLHMDLNPISKLQAYSFSEISAREISLHSLHDLRIVDGFAFHNMYNLSVLIMHDNEKLSFIDPEAFANATTLRKLSLHNNNLRGLIKYRNKPLKEVELLKLPKDCPPSIIDFTTNRSLIRKLGDPLTMECRALGIPVPKLHWLLPDGTVLNSTSNSVRVRLRNPGTLIFYHLKATDSGQYACVAENSAGTHNVTVTLRVTGIDIHLFPTGISSTFITLVWNGTARNAFPSYQILYKLADEDTVESKWFDDQVSSVNCTSSGSGVCGLTLGNSKSASGKVVSKTKSSISRSPVPPAAVHEVHMHLPPPTVTASTSQSGPPCECDYDIN
ncbi:hypothetical protein B566_EDAN017045 [Ephemera danica]|nr:hypothetical protein B566_EDAN017045 [Ephemera danica]